MFTSKIYILRYLFKTLWFPLLSFYSQLIDVLRLLIGSYKPILPRKNFVILFPGQPRLLVLNFPLLFILSRLGICYISVEKQDVRSALSKFILSFLKYKLIYVDSHLFELGDTSITPNMYQWFKLSALLNDDQLNAHIESNNVQFILKFRTDFHCINLLDSITHVASCCSDPFFPCGSTFCFSDVFFTIPRNLLAFYRDLEILNLEPSHISSDDYIHYFNQSNSSTHFKDITSCLPTRLSWRGIQFLNS